jgi:hypothetical protein
MLFTHSYEQKNDVIINNQTNDVVIINETAFINEITIWKKEFKISFIEFPLLCILFVWVFSIFIEEIIQVCTIIKFLQNIIFSLNFKLMQINKRFKSLKRTVFSYLKQGWNMLDMFCCMCFLTRGFCRLIAYWNNKKNLIFFSRFRTEI